LGVPISVSENMHTHVYITKEIGLSPVTGTTGILRKSTKLLLNTTVIICFHRSPSCIQLSTPLKSSNSCFQLLFAAENYWQPYCNLWLFRIRWQQQRETESFEGLDS